MRRFELSEGKSHNFVFFRDLPGDGTGVVSALEWTVAALFPRTKGLSAMSTTPPPGRSAPVQESLVAIAWSELVRDLESLRS